ncbi:MAG: glycosyltransferase [Rehaibacterium terrae]|uniref:glycosyltransferase n=1 Tax=Rehaibacterium terrae TaxID=1341696 RepID=UPI003919FF03
MRVCVVTVTYGNRFHLLKQVIDSALQEGVSKVIVVDNNSEPESREKLKAYERELGESKLKVIYLDENYGSAGGYKRGLEEAYNDPDCEFIWLLDDDNKPLEGSLKELLNFWNSLEVADKEQKVALLSYRFNQMWFHVLNYRIKKNRQPVELLKNSFCGFHITDLPTKISFWFTFSYKSKNDNKTNYILTIPFGPYGGLFLNKKLIDRIGFPNENFYLYADDTEWTYRITKLGGTIYLVFNSKLEDIVLTYGNTPYFYNMSKGDSYRVYYSIRNGVYFQIINGLIENKIIWTINMLVYILAIGLFSKKNLKIIIRAIKDAFRGKLGKVNLDK